MYCIVQLLLSMSTRGPAWLQSKQQQQPAASVPAQPPMSTPSQASPSTTSTASQAHHAHLAVMATPPLDGSNGPHKDHTDLPPHAAHMPTHPVRTPGPCTIAVYVCLFVCSSVFNFDDSPLTDQDCGPRTNFPNGCESPTIHLPPHPQG